MKGQIYTLESAIAILMVLSITIILFKNQPNLPELQEINYKQKIYGGLKTLDATGKLGFYAIKNDANSIQNELQPYIPTFLEYKVVIYDQTTNVTEKPYLEDQNKVISVSYFLAGDVDNYEPRDVRVYLWGLI
jgi:hypothetical protein